MIQLQACPLVIAPSRRDQDRERTLVLPRLFAHPLWLLPLLWGVLDLRRVSISAKVKTFLLSMCIDAPESKTNSLSSGNFEVGAGIALASTGE